jgi:hypothetical protein
LVIGDFQFCHFLTRFGRPGVIASVEQYLTSDKQQLCCLGRWLSQYERQVLEDTFSITALFTLSGSLSQIQSSSSIPSSAVVPACGLGTFSSTVSWTPGNSAL